MARATVALTPQIQKRMDVLSKVFEGWEEDCMNCKAFAASLADWTTPKGAEVIREGEDAAQPQLLICESGAAASLRAHTYNDGLFFGNIDNAAFFAAFEAFAKRTFCAENVVFLRGYRDLQTETDAAAAAERLFATTSASTRRTRTTSPSTCPRRSSASRRRTSPRRGADDVAALPRSSTSAPRRSTDAHEDIIPNFMNGDEYRAYLLGAWPLPRPPKRRSTACGLM
ncbi:hypothetical protein JL720_13617 [Aureococcus anophagefferens]|nr:hypothetical protein JL720_13617 [Aureococcus anophagefferens]